KHRPPLKQPQLSFGPPLAGPAALALPLRHGRFACFAELCGRSSAFACLASFAVDRPAWHADGRAVGSAAIAAAFEHVLFAVVDNHLRDALGAAGLELVSALLQLGNGIGREAVLLIGDLIRQPLMVETGRV